MEKQRRINTFVICGLMIVLGAMTVGFAALSQRLDINGTALVKSVSSSWNVHFSNVDTSNGLAGSGTWSTAPSISSDASNNGSSNKISFGCELVAPGDSCEVTATIKNGGSITAKYAGYSLTIDGESKTGTSVTLDDHVVVTVTPAVDWVANTTELSQNGTGNFVIKMELPSTTEELPSEQSNHTISLSINFEQKD